MTQRNANGFSLIELAMVLTVFGLITGGVFSYLSMKAERDTLQTTQDRQKKIAVALSEFQAIRGFLPCPGAPNDPNLGAMRSACTTAATLVGVVPFRNLGLTQEDATDGYGRPFTYAVSNRAANVTNGSMNPSVHAYCRKNNIWVSGAANINPYKARFCCQLVADANALNVTDAAGVSLLNTYTQGTTPTAADYNTETTAYTIGAALSQIRTTYFAYALISHGRNGLGAYIFEGTRRPTTGAAANELENTDDNDNIIVDQPISSTAPIFDDIVFWRTQEQVVAETRTTNCARP